MKDLSGVDFIVVDTEKKNNSIKKDLALKVAEWFSAKYISVDDLKAETILEIVRSHKNL
ncbi:hypothetical protein [Thermodesulfobacterium hveragerdense]|uniref:hypothetical protein n=1 Tax=Thermodesulfobacterium hveragerdense TaxID=53424 RepID=UPI00042276CD|nr:hypothetical protein [Thermodesulfobacterium hveragerdense]